LKRTIILVILGIILGAAIMISPAPIYYAKIKNHRGECTNKTETAFSLQRRTNNTIIDALNSIKESFKYTTEAMKTEEKTPIGSLEIVKLALIILISIILSLAIYLKVKIM